MTKLTKKELDRLKIKAQKLYVEKGLTANEISKTIPISEKSVGVWVKKFGWKAKRDVKVSKKLGAPDVKKDCKAFVIGEFKQFVKDSNPILFNQLQPMFETFLNYTPEL